MEDLFDHVAALPDSGRDATTAFTSGTGDVLLSYENEAILARQNDTDFDYVVPDSSLLIQNPCAVTEDAPASAADFLDFQKSKPRVRRSTPRPGSARSSTSVTSEVDGANDPTDPFPDPATLLTIDDDFDGWGEANDTYFGDGQDGNPLGILTKIQADSGV